MKIIYNNYIPFAGFKAMMLFGLIFVRGKRPLRKEEINHELIHLRQQVELLFIFFFAWYVVEYVVRLFQYRFNANRAYRNISFEREAYGNEKERFYLKRRKSFSFLRYL